ncbi:hypothetical protein D9615_003452 [Tricholomella constricta]|uniref:Uncharacterized protein n=1 Tax=Tricholomella constricta TaxID=117010 RepID=A0A8H5HJG1_9AGAR|nr:hypothetical protein D9615_003452 [Tricholomella constricta]
MSTSTTQQMTIPFSLKSLTFNSEVGLPSRTSTTQHDGLPVWARPLARAPDGMGEEMGIYGPDPELDRIEECGPYLLCIRPPSPRTNNSYIIRLYHQGTREVVIAVDPPVSVYNALYPDFGVRTILGMCWWIILEEYSFLVKYEGQLVCRWGGERVVQQLPYERGSRARIVDQLEDLASRD